MPYDDIKVISSLGYAYITLRGKIRSSLVSEYKIVVTKRLPNLVCLPVSYSMILLRETFSTLGSKAKS